MTDDRAALAKFRLHSVALNRILWRMLESLGDVAPEATEHFDDIDAIADRFFAAWNRRAEARAPQAVTYPCGCTATGGGDGPLPTYCPEHGEARAPQAVPPVAWRYQKSPRVWILSATDPTGRIDALVIEPLYPGHSPAMPNIEQLRALAAPVEPAQPVCGLQHMGGQIFECAACGYKARHDNGHPSRCMAAPTAQPVTKAP